MKIIHCADVHLDSRLNSKLANAKQQKIRIAELLIAFENMLKYASQIKATAVIIAGDLFDAASASLTIVDHVLDLIIKYNNILFYYLPGNHDETNALAILEELPTNLQVFTSDWKYCRIDNVVITGAVLATQNYKSIYDKLSLNENDINIVTLHGQIDTVLRDNKPEHIPLNMLKGKYIDYLALGHIHSYSASELDNRGKHAYSGCLEGRGFDELGQKGFVVLDIDTTEKTIKHEFVPNSIRTYNLVKVDISKAQSISDVIEFIDKGIVNLKDTDVVRVELVGEIDEDLRFSEDVVVKKYEKSFFYFEMKNRTKFKLDASIYKNTLSLHGKLIEIVEKNETDENIANDIIKTALRVLNGEEVEL